MKLQVVVQHSPARAELVGRLLERLSKPIVVVDPGGEVSSAWRTYRLCLRTEIGDATHIVVIQDDATVCEHFEEAAASAIAAKPGAAIAFWLGGQPARTGLAATRAKKARENWARWQTQDWFPTVCSSYPVEVARRAADWIERKPGRHPRNDDAPMGEFLRAHRQIEAWATVPSLAEHSDDAPSLIGRKYMAGRNPGRVARFPIGEREDARLIRW